MNKRIVIVGGGVIGCSTAFYLTKLGHKDVTVIEAGVKLQCFSSRKENVFNIFSFDP